MCVGVSECETVSVCGSLRKKKNFDWQTLSRGLWGLRSHCKRFIGKIHPTIHRGPLPWGDYWMTSESVTLANLPARQQIKFLQQWRGQPLQLPYLHSWVQTWCQIQNREQLSEERSDFIRTAGRENVPVTVLGLNIMIFSSLKWHPVSCWWINPKSKVRTPSCFGWIEGSGWANQGHSDFSDYSDQPPCSTSCKTPHSMKLPPPSQGWYWASDEVPGRLQLWCLELWSKRSNWKSGPLQLFPLLHAGALELSQGDLGQKALGSWTTEANRTPITNTTTNEKSVTFWR